MTVLDERRVIFPRQRQARMHAAWPAIAEMRLVLLTTAGALVPCALVVSLVAGIGLVFERLRVPETDAFLFARVGLLLGLAYKFLGERVALSGELAVTSSRVVSHLIAAALVVMVAMLASTSTSITRPRAAWVGSVTAAAFVEEVVFRVLLPNRIERNLSTHFSPHLALAFAIMTSQAAFATSHFHMEPVPFRRLVAAGVLLYAILHRIGLWLAIALHTLVNVSVALAPTTSGVTRSHAEGAMWLVGSACLASFALTRVYRANTSDLQLKRQSPQLPRHRTQPSSP